MQKDTIVIDLIRKELDRQRYGIELHRFQKIAFPPVIQPWNCAYPISYADGVPGKRYYGGCK
jgi:glycine hydroxymethyltransferase